MNCKAPTCHYSDAKKKCVKPNPYFEALAWCKRNNITFAQCKKDYNKEEATKRACKRYEEKKLYKTQKKQCKDGSVINPKTGRCIKIKTVKPAKTIKNANKPPKNIKKHAVIQDFYDDKDIKKSFRTQLSKNSTSRKVRYMLEKVKANRIQDFFKRNLLKKYFTLEKRVKYYNYVANFLKPLNDVGCLEKKVFYDTKDANKKYNGYTVHNTVDLEKRIGSDSVYGVIFKTSIKNMLGRAPIASKLMPITNNNVKEANINMMLSKIILHKQLSRHFLFSYKLFVCNKPSSVVPKVIAKSSYLIALNEMAHGDLQSLCDNMAFLKNDELLMNIAIQCMLSIATFHNIGYLHSDCHWGNFLYHLTDDKSGYYHYKIYGENYYLKNCGYTMMIYDFGLCNKYPFTTNKLLHQQTMMDLATDYIHILNAFKNTALRGWSKSQVYPRKALSTYIDNLQSSLKFSSLASKHEKGFIKNILLNYLLQNPYKRLFVKALPKGERIVNTTTPFIIDETLYQN
jgi:hypothetical protein